MANDAEQHTKVSKEVIIRYTCKCVGFWPVPRSLCDRAQVKEITVDTSSGAYMDAGVCCPICSLYFLRVIGGQMAEEAVKLAIAIGSSDAVNGEN